MPSPPPSTYTFDVRGGDFDDLLNRAQANAERFWGHTDYFLALDAEMGNLAANMDGTVQILDYTARVYTTVGKVT